MQTIEREEPALIADEQLLQLKRRSRTLAWITAVLAVAALALGAWLVAEVTASDGASLPADVEVALDDYLAAWEATDGPAFLAATSEDYTFRTEGNEFPRSRQAGAVDSLVRFEVTTSERTAAGDGPYFIAQTETIESGVGTYAETWEGLSVITVDETADGWKVVQHTWTGDN